MLGATLGSFACKTAGEAILHYKQAHPVFARLYDIAARGVANGIQKYKKLDTKLDAAWHKGKEKVGERICIAPFKTIHTNIKWGKGIHEQGMPWEDFLAKSLPADARLPRNFKTFDFYDMGTKTAISAKTLNTQTASKLANPEKIYHSLKKNIDAAAGFTEYKLLREEVTSNLISMRHLEVAIPRGTNSTQWAQIQKAIRYGQDKGIQVKITEVK